MQSPADGVASFSRERTCENCGKASQKGKFGDPGSEYAHTWYCTKCWDQWQEDDRAGRLPPDAPAPEREKARPSADLCAHCGAATGLGGTSGDAASRRYCAACRSSWEGLAKPREAKAPARASSEAKAGPGTKCLRDGCLYARHPRDGHAFCCYNCMEDRSPHGHSCEQTFVEEALRKLSMAELRNLCGDRGIAVGDCIEKEDMVSRLLRSSATSGPSRGAKVSGSGGAVQGGGSGKALEAMSVSELLQQARLLGVDASGCVEKADLVARIRAGGHSARAAASSEEPPARGEPGLIEECDPSEVQREALDDSDSESIEEVNMEALWRSQSRQAASAPAELRPTAKLPSTTTSAAPCVSTPAPAKRPPVEAPASPEPPPPPPPPPPPLTLPEAVRAGDAAAATAALARLGDEAKAALESIDGSGRTLLHLCAVQAAGEGRGQIARALLEHGARPDARDARGLTPLALAVAATLDAPSEGWTGGLETVMALLRAGAAPLALRRWRSERCALASGLAGPAAASVAELLLRAGADLPWHHRSLRAAAEAGDADAAEEALERLGRQARAALQAVDHGEGRSLLHICAAQASEAGSARIAAMLLSHSARVDLQDSSGRTPLAIAVSQAIEALEEQKAHAQATVTALLAGGVPPGVDAEWRPQDSALARAAADPVVNSIAEYLLEAGVDLPWHPLSLHGSVAGGDLQAVEGALERLGKGAEAAVRAGGGPDGRCALHVCAASAAPSDAGKIVRLLLEKSARAEVRDAAGRTPAALAAEVALAAAGEPEAAAPALDVLGVLLGAAPVREGEVEEWYGQRSVLAEMAETSPGREVAELLKRAGAQMPWYDQLLDLQAQCAELGIPVGVIGRVAAKNVIRACERWQGLTVKELRAECQTRRLEQKLCVEKSDIQRCLRQARVREELAVLEDPDSRLVGTWCYAMKWASKDYAISRDEDGNLVFDGPHVTMGRVHGVLEPQEDGSFLSTLVSNEVEVGEIRLTYCDKDRTMTSQYKGVAMVVWGREIAAFKEAPPAPEPSPEASEAGAAEEPAGAAEAEVEEAEAEDIDDAEDLAAAFMAAAARRDARAVERGLARARREEGSAEELACLLDADANSALHLLCSGPPGRRAARWSEGPRVVRLLVEAQAEVNDANVLGETPLLLAVRAPPGAALGLVNAILAAGGEPDVADLLLGETAMMEAASRGDMEVCQALLEAKADPAKKNSEGLTARDIAAECDQSHVARLLRSFCPSPADEALLRRARPLWDAVEASDVEAASAALEELGEEAQVAVDMRGGMDRGGRTLLHVCGANVAHDAAGEVARRLVDAAASPDRADVGGKTPLEVAVAGALALQEGHWGAMDVIRVLLVAGASVSVAAWREPRGELARAWHASLGAAEAVCRILLAFDAQLPWHGKPPPEEGTREAFPEEAAEAEPEPAPSGEAEDPLLAAACAEHAVPLERLGAARAEAVLRFCERFKKMKVEELRFECNEEGVPTAGCVEKSDLEARLRQVKIWQEMLEKDLDVECTLRGISLALDFVPRSTKEEALKQHEWGSSASGKVRRSCELKGVPYDRLDLERAAEVLRQIENLEAMKVADLKEEYVKEFLTLEASMEKQEMLSRLKAIIIWSALPIPALLTECRESGLKVSNASQEILIQQLKAAKWPLAAPTKSRYSGFFSYKTDAGYKEKEREQQQREQQREREREREQQERERQQSDYQEQFQRNMQNNDKWAEWASRNWSPYQRFGGGGPRKPGMPLPNVRRNVFTSGQQRPNPPPPSAKVVTPGIDRHFRTLGLPPSATGAEVRKKYKKLCLQLHPDKNPSQDSEKRFKEVVAAYEEVCQHFRLTGADMS